MPRPHASRKPPLAGGGGLAGWLPTDTIAHYRSSIPWTLSRSSGGPRRGSPRPHTLSSPNLVKPPEDSWRLLPPDAPLPSPQAPDEPDPVAWNVEVPAAAQKPRKGRGGILEAFVLALIALALALTLKTYVAEAYEIKGRSMEPTFLTGQRVVVLKAFYDIQRFDIVVFTSTEDASKDLIKRVVGLPGETLRVSGGKVYVNGKRVQETYGVRHDARELLEEFPETRIPPDHYYVLGDNRPDSHDSRYFEAIRGVPRSPGFWRRSRGRWSA